MHKILNKKEKTFEIHEFGCSESDFILRNRYENRKLYEKLI